MYGDLKYWYLRDHKLFRTSRQTATQLLNEMENNGTLLYNRKEIIITDITKL